MGHCVQTWEWDFPSEWDKNEHRFFNWSKRSLADTVGKKPPYDYRFKKMQCWITVVVHVQNKLHRWNKTINKWLNVAMSLRISWRVIIRALKSFGHRRTLLGTWRGLTMMLLPDPTGRGPRLTPVSDFGQLPSFGSVRASGGVSLFWITSDSPSVPWAHFSAASSPPVTVGTEEDLPCAWVVTSSTVLACLEELSLRGAAGGFLLLWTI